MDCLVNVFQCVCVLTVNYHNFLITFQNSYIIVLSSVLAKGKSWKVRLNPGQDPTAGFFSGLLSVLLTSFEY